MFLSVKTDENKQKANFIVMQELIKKGTYSTPTVILDAENNKFEISGRSLPEDVVAFYNSILDWLDEYAKSPNEKTEFNFKLVYYNTASSKMLYEILKKLEKIAIDGHDIVVKWHYDEDDEDMEEAGEEYAEVVEELPFEQVAY